METISLLTAIKHLVVTGDEEDEIQGLVQRAIEQGLGANAIIHDGLLAGMEEVGKLWKEGEVFIPEVIRAAEVLKSGMSMISGELIAIGGIRSLGTVVIGTVKGDVHDIGKSLVRMMMEATGFTVHDLGVDVAPDRFAAEAFATRAQMVCMSAMLTTTMPQMRLVLEALKEAGLSVKTMVGGAPLNQMYSDSIGADGYAPDAISAVDEARRLLGLA